MYARACAWDAWAASLSWLQAPGAPIRGARVGLKVHRVVAPAWSSVCLSFLDRMTVWLSTAPTEPLTHWYQVRCLFQSPLFAKAGDTLSGTCLLIANKRCELPPGAGGGRGSSTQPAHGCPSPALSADRAMTSVLWPR